MSAEVVWAARRGFVDAAVIVAGVGVAGIAGLGREPESAFANSCS